MTTTVNKKIDRLNLPEVNWSDKASDPEKFFRDLSYALSEYGFMVLTNAPGFSDDFQQKAFQEVRGFFDSPMDLKKQLTYLIRLIFVDIACQLQLIVVTDKS